MAYLTSAPRAARASANCFTWCWACAKAIPYPGTIITRLAVANFSTGSSSFFSFPSCGVSISGDLSATCCLCTLGLRAKRIEDRRRFIALHIICVRSKPDAPTIPPTATSSTSPIAIPAIAPATPLSELSREMVIGISAPPTRIEK